MGTLNTSNINLTGNFNGNQPGFRVTLDTSRALQGTGVQLWNASNGLNGNYFTTVKFNIGNCFNTSTSVFTAPATGFYLWNQVMATSSGGASQSYSSCEYYVNGTRTGKSGWSELPAGYQRWTATDYIQLNAGDLVTFGGEWQQTTTFTNQSHIMMYFLG
tara:strand:- start:95 stop:574 length:480 start_codon:yes stop_codon:yes gene_type:complete